MFTGLVEEMGQCLWLRQTTAGTQLTISATSVTRDTRSGDSIAVNGCCLTVTSKTKDQLVFDLLAETLARTNLSLLRPGHPVNLERAVRADSRMGGHFVQGHVDTTTCVLATEDKAADRRIAFALPHGFRAYVAYKGSVTINGVSLTIAEVSDDAFAIWVIPHTRAVTNLGTLAKGDTVNVEFDILAKYVERAVAYAPR